MENHAKILIVDDEYKIIDVLKSYMQLEGFIVFVAFSGIEALEIFKTVQPDLVILDRMLPSLNGGEVCQKIRRDSNCPIIMLTAKAQDEDVVGGLQLGADDYVTKPFSVKQLVARVHALLRRTKGQITDTEAIMKFNKEELKIDTLRWEVTKKDKTLNVTPNEFRILQVMAKYSQKTFTRGELIRSAFGEDFDGFDRTVDAHIKNIRHKIEDDPKEPKYIITVHGVGYRFFGGAGC